MEADKEFSLFTDTPNLIYTDLLLLIRNADIFAYSSNNQKEILYYRKILDVLLNYTSNTENETLMHILCNTSISPKDISKLQSALKQYTFSLDENNRQKIINKFVDILNNKACFLFLISAQKRKVLIEIDKKIQSKYIVDMDKYVEIKEKIESSYNEVISVILRTKRISLVALLISSIEEKLEQMDLSLGKGLATYINKDKLEISTLAQDTFYGENTILEQNKLFEQLKKLETCINEDDRKNGQFTSNDTSIKEYILLLCQVLEQSIAIIEDKKKNEEYIKKVITDVDKNLSEVLEDKDEVLNKESKSEIKKLKELYINQINLEIKKEVDKTNNIKENLLSNSKLYESYMRSLKLKQTKSTEKTTKIDPLSYLPKRLIYLKEYLLPNNDNNPLLKGKRLIHSYGGSHPYFNILSDSERNLEQDGIIISNTLAIIRIIIMYLSIYFFTSLFFLYFINFFIPSFLTISHTANVDLIYRMLYIIIPAVSLLFSLASFFISLPVYYFMTKKILKILFLLGVFFILLGIITPLIVSLKYGVISAVALDFTFKVLLIISFLSEAYYGILNINNRMRGINGRKHISIKSMKTLLPPILSLLSFFIIIYFFSILYQIDLPNSIPLETTIEL